MAVKTFINYYAVLGLSPSASSAAIDQRFRHLALRYHPDNLTTGDRSKFDAILESHSKLRDAARRSKYHEENLGYLPPFIEALLDRDEPESPERAEEKYDDNFVGNIGIEKDVSIQNNILVLLYLKRRRNIRNPGIGDAELEQLSGCPAEHLEFHIWYLKAKGWISTGEDGLLAITIDGVDRAAFIYQEGAQKLITDQS